jgi:signal transduction histidine kinase/AmiR/NasT family two-component response regulator
VSTSDHGALLGPVRWLRQRLDQQAHARAAADASALRPSGDRQEVLALLEAIAVASNDDQPLEDTLRLALGRICEFMGWPVGHVYWVDGDQHKLYSSGIWHGVDGPEREDFRRSTGEAQLWRGRGLPGRVLASGQPVWVPDVAQDDNFPRRASAERCGLHAAFAFPVLIASDTAAIYEFFCLQTVPPDGAVLRAMAQIGSVLGRAIERKRAEEQLHEQVAEAQAARRTAEAANRAKSDFLAITSHEVRTPLNAVLGLAEALRSEPLTERQTALVDGVLDAGAMLLRLLNAVLDVTRIESGKMELAIEPFDLRRCAESVVEIWRPRAAERAVTLVVSVDPLAPGQGLVSDRGKIEQVLINFVSNAMKFTPVGGRIAVRVALGAAEGGRSLVRLEVSDEGPGVPVSERERIFRPFEQTAAGREAGGAGLGLSICAGHAALLGGTIGVETAPGGGACFFMAFPAEFAAPRIADEPPPATTPGPALMHEPMVPPATPVGGPTALRVLAAEDHPANRMVLQALLEPLGVAVTFVVNGRDAVDAVTGADYDLVLMDVQMPVLDGVGALQAIRVLPGAAARTPVHMITANVFEEDVRRYREAGADGVLKKPIDVRELFTLVEQTRSASRLAELADDAA